MDLACHASVHYCTAHFNALFSNVSEGLIWLDMVMLFCSYWCCSLENIWSSNKYCEITLLLGRRKYPGAMTVPSGKNIAFPRYKNICCGRQLKWWWRKLKSDANWTLVQPTIRPIQWQWWWQRRYFLPTPLHQQSWVLGTLPSGRVEFTLAASEE